MSDATLREPNTKVVMWGRKLCDGKDLQPRTGREFPEVFAETAGVTVRPSLLSDIYPPPLDCGNLQCGEETENSLNNLRFGTFSIGAKGPFARHPIMVATFGGPRGKMGATRTVQRGLRDLRDGKVLRHIPAGTNAKPQNPTKTVATPLTRSGRK